MVKVQFLQSGLDIKDEFTLKTVPFQRHASTRLGCTVFSLASSEAPDMFEV